MKSLNLNAKSTGYIILLSFINIAVIYNIIIGNMEDGIVVGIIFVIVVTLLSTGFSYELSYTNFKKDHVIIYKLYAYRKLYYKDLKNISKDSMIIDYVNPKKTRAGSLIFKPKKGRSITVAIYDNGLYHQLLDFFEIELEMKLQDEDKVRAYHRRRKKEKKLKKQKEKLMRK